METTWMDNNSHLWKAGFDADFSEVKIHTDNEASANEP